jgi:hypothetical protein
VHLDIYDQLNSRSWQVNLGFNLSDIKKGLFYSDLMKKINVEDYKLFTESMPQHLSEDSTLWTMKNAREYFNWFVSIQEIRIDMLSRILDYKFLGNPKSDLNIIYKLTVNVLNSYDLFFKFYGNGKRIDFGPYGLSLACDVGIYLGHCLIMQNPSLEWMISKFQNKRLT